MRRLLTVTFFTGLLTLIKMFSGFVVAKIVAVYTGPTGIVMLGQIQSIVTTLNGLVNSPVGPGIVRFTSENDKNGYGECAKWWQASTRWVALILAIILPLTILTSSYISSWVLGTPDFGWVLVITAFLLPFTAAGTFIASVINGQQQYKKYVVLGMVSAILSLAIMLLLIIVGNIYGALLAVAVQNAVVGIVMILYSLRKPWFKIKYLWGQVDSRSMKDIRGYILMAVTSAIVVPCSLILIRNIIVQHAGWTQAGYWQAVWRISETYLAIITIALSTYYLPRLSAIKDNKLIVGEINATLKVVLPVVVLCATGVYILKDFIISVLFTKEFYSARDLFKYQLLGDVLKIISWLYAYTMISKGMTKIFVLSEIVFATSFVAISYFFVIHYGVYGAPMAYCVNYSLYLLFAIFVVYRVKS